MLVNAWVPEYQPSDNGGPVTESVTLMYDDFIVGA